MRISVLVILFVAVVFLVVVPLIAWLLARRRRGEQRGFEVRLKDPE